MINGGGPAFPQTGFMTGNGDIAFPVEYDQGGMTLLDWFAAHIECSDDISMEFCVAAAGKQPKFEDGVIQFMEWVATWQAKWRYIQAEAMLAERERRMKKC